MEHPTSMATFFKHIVDTINASTLRIITYRICIAGVTGLSIFMTAGVSAQAIKNTSIENTYQKIIYKAADLAKQAYEEKSTSIPSELSAIGYQQYRAIRFAKDKALWKDATNFEVQLFHPGFLYQKPVKINEVMNETVSSIPFSTNLFNYDFSYDGQTSIVNKLARTDLDFSGFRIHYPLNNTEYKDELIVFQGASYFRPLGPGLNYGVSARGLAIDTAEPSGEEFPSFVEFWLVKPDPTDNKMVIYALLDSPSITGAYRFELLPGYPTKVRVRADLFSRKEVKKIGISALTSMFFYGENKVKHIDDFRPEVHDSDGLLVATNRDEWIWRPLFNPSQLRVSSFSLVNPKGFGLLQRDRHFSHYEDLEANYHKRPSIWVSPLGRPWGKGRVELVEIPTQNETNDNIVVYWVPENRLKPNEQYTLEYSLTIIDTPHDRILGKVAQTLIGWGAVPGQDNPPPKRQRIFVIDFAGWPEDYTPGGLDLKPVLKHSSGTVTDVQVVRLPDGHAWRVYFKLLPVGNRPIDINLSLHLNKQQLTETWSYVWYTDNLE
ncbi:MAG: glucans biosynthesis protein [Cellvibrionaceae bacterium]|jgi:glucans biosynthesis protein